MPDISKEIALALPELSQVVFSQSADSGSCTKVIFRPVVLKGSPYIQIESFRASKAYHENITADDVAEYVKIKLAGKFRQVLIVSGSESRQYVLKRDGSYKRTATKAVVARPEGIGTHNKAKNYILSEGEAIPALVDLGIFTQDYRIIKAKYDKYKQINRFIELVDDEFNSIPVGTELTILDFGCGKSYLTFILYWYFTVKRGADVSIIGYDLKEDVVADCQRIAESYGYDKLSFQVADVTKDVLCDRRIDMMVTLHACDTATDYALEYAVKKRARYIFSVPCCQHEVNLSIHTGGDLDILLKYGVVKERISALLTDSIRASLLEDAGYSVDVIEFIDIEHSPKNIMLRAKLSHPPSDKNRAAIEELQTKYGFEQSLIALIGKSK